MGSNESGAIAEIKGARESDGREFAWLRHEVHAVETEQYQIKTAESCVMWT